MTTNTLRYEATFADVEPVNPLFSSCKIYVCYADENRNGSVLPKDVIEDAIGTIYNIPIVGRFSEDLDDFVDHGGKIEVTGQGADKEIKYVHTTVPYGLVPESANITWETIDDKEYLVIEGALLWTGRYPEAQVVIDEGRPQSMEIEVVSGRFNKQKQFVVNEFVFSALCILGDDVEPAFEDAQITAYSLNKETFEQQFSAMLQELKFSLKEGGNDTLKVKEGYKWNFTLTSEQLEAELSRMIMNHETFVDPFWQWEDPRYCFVDYMPDQGVVVAMDWMNNYLVGFNFTVEGDMVTINFDSALRYKIDYVPMDINVSEDDDSHTTNLADKDVFSLIKERMDKMKEFAKKNGGKDMDNTLDADNGLQTFNDNDPAVEPAVEPTTEPVAEPSTEPSTEPVTEPPVKTDAPTSAEFAELSRQFTELKEMFAAVQPELEQLRKFKAEKEAQERTEAENALFERFSAHLSEEEIASIREKASEFTLENLETQLYVLVGKKSSQFSAKSQTKYDNSSNRMLVFDQSGDTLINSDKPYASLVARLGK
ncbi:hypothetical protein QB910_000020 [Dabrowskivirus KKP3916]|uniref:Uncharacterized protein n=1 Tax=Alicyclobacillus phage KKP_3916 TaxID=3040651 RepID=A0AAT9V7H2_9CAUD|nr:hypothetical protein QB910_000020 [Alicyclobacillus phage KKP 3916]